MSSDAPVAGHPATGGPAAPAPTSAPQQPPPSSQFVQYPGAYGQAYQPYQQYDMTPNNNMPRWSTLHQQIPHGAQVIEPPRILETKKAIMTKMGFHSVGFIFGLVILGLGLTFVNDWGLGIIMIIMNSVLAGVSILWSGTELITRAVRKFKHGVHPGAHVGICLIIWLTAAVVGGLSTAVTVSALYYDGYWGSYYCDSSYSSYGYSSYEDCDEPTGRNAILVASTVFSWFQAIIYFVLFVIGCIDTHRHNAAKSRPIMLVPQSAWAPEMGGIAQPPNAYHYPGPMSGDGLMHGMPPPPHQQHHAHTAPGALPPQVSEKGQGPAGSSHNSGVQEYYTPGPTA